MERRDQQKSFLFHFPPRPLLLNSGVQEAQVIPHGGWGPAETGGHLQVTKTLCLGPGCGQWQVDR